MEQTEWKEKYFELLKENSQLKQANKQLHSQLQSYTEKTQKDQEIILSLKQKIRNLKSQFRTSQLSDSSFEECFQSLCSPYTSLHFSMQKYKCLHRQVAKEYTEVPLERNYSGTLTSPRMFEEFFIIGSELSEVDKLKILFQFPSETNDQWKVLPTFAFPEGLKTSRISEDSSVISRGSDRTGSSFVFTIKSSMSQEPFFFEVPNKDKELLYCCCVVQEEVLCSKSGEHYSQPRCYCLVSHCAAFQLHFQVLFKLLDLKNLYVEDSQLINDEMFGLLEEYAENYNFSPSSNIFINLQSVDSIEYSFPFDLSNLDSQWFCPLMFSLLELSDFFWLLCAAMQEKSIVFVSQKLDRVTSCVLGLVSLMKPFKWSHVLTPILPNSLFDILEAPVPFIAGVKKPPDNLLSAYSHIVWVLLDEKSKILKLGKVQKQVKVPYANNMLSYLKLPYSKFAGEECLVPNLEQKECTKRILGEICKYWKEILGLLPPVLPDQKVLDLDHINIVLMNKANPLDQNFIRKLIETQLFINKIEELYKLQES